jgi:hypothetical protein
MKMMMEKMREMAVGRVLMVQKQRAYQADVRVVGQWLI